MAALLILGAHGQVGRAVAAKAARRDLDIRALGHADCDISDQAAVTRVVAGARIVINCAAYTAVDRAENNAEAAFRINTTGASNVAAACAQGAVPLIHLSTDYVFDGDATKPARETDPPRPLNVYGRSKLGGEIAIRDHQPAHIILRTSWIFSPHGDNFVKTMLRLAAAQEPLRVVDDQIGGPTAADDIAKAILDITAACTRSDFSDWGTYHFCGAPAVSWYEFARAIVAHKGTPVLPIATKDFPRPAQRPMKAVLDCSRIFEIFGIEQPDWRIALRKLLAEME